MWQCMWHGLCGMPRGFGLRWQSSTAYVACDVDLELGGNPCGTLLLVLLLVYNSVSTKLAKSTKKGANFC